MKKNIFYTAILMLAGTMMAACSGSDDILSETNPESQTPTKGVVLKGILGSKGDLTRTIAEDGTSSWEVGDQLAIYYETSNGHASATATIENINDDGSANFTATLSAPKTGSNNVSLVYPASAHDGNGGFKTDALMNQQGTLAYISQYGLDIETATTTLNVEGTTATLKNSVVMQPEVCLYQIAAKKWAAETNGLLAMKMEISDGTHKYTIDNYGYYSPVIAMLPVNNADITIVSTTVLEGYFYTKLNTTLATCTTANIGDVIDEDGNIYRVTKGPGKVYSKTFNNVTLQKGRFYKETVVLDYTRELVPAAMIAYVGAHGSVDDSSTDPITGYHGLAISMRDIDYNLVAPYSDDPDWVGSLEPSWSSKSTTSCTPAANRCENVEDARTLRNGITITRLLCNCTEHIHHAARACVNFKYGINYADVNYSPTRLPSASSGWFLPSLGQWQLMIRGMVGLKENLSGPSSSVLIGDYNNPNDKVKGSYFNSVLSDCWGASLYLYGEYWSCTESDERAAWSLDFYWGLARNNSKSGKRVRPVFAF